MASLLEKLQQCVSGDTLEQLSRQLGADPGTTRSAISAALPILVGALARNASTTQGADSLTNALNDHDGSVLDNVGSALSNYQQGPGAAILGHVLGESRDPVEQGVSRSSGMAPEKAGALLQMLAPLVLGALGKAKRQDGLDAAGVASMLGAEAEQAGSRIPGGLGSILQMLDTNKSGSVMDEAAGMVGKIFGNRSQ
ncbi:MAG TPA: DUF937 domain-containing protein [Gemmatimonadaceae bacterium]